MSYNKISNTIGSTNVQHTNKMLNPQVKTKGLVNSSNQKIYLKNFITQQKH